jgi:signal transduction histidine kinase
MVQASRDRDRVLDEILTYVELGDADRARLMDLGRKLAPQFPEIAERFYERVAKNPRAAQLLSGPAQVERLRATLVDWMASGLSGPYDDRFYDKRSRIGRRHVAIRLPQHYMFTAMNVIRGEYDDRIARLYDLEDARLVAKSVDKLLDLELALMLRHYQLDSEERLVARERSTQAERVLAIQTLSAGLAHEVRNPLNSAKLQLELLDRRLRRDGEDPKLMESIEIIHHELERLTHLLKEFLAFARPSDLTLGDHDILAIARGIAAAERPLAEARGATLQVAGNGPLIARVDNHKLQQILQNLVRNAIEAVTTGGHVTVAATGDDEQIYLAVEDDGPGIPEQIQRRIYEPFFSTKESGTGLGMSIVHSMVTLHGGTIAINTSPRGTRFDVAMPRRLAS